MPPVVGKYGLSYTCALLITSIIVILPDKPRPAARNFEIINMLQTEVERQLFVRPGAYDGRKNLFMPFELPFGEQKSGEVRVFQVPDYHAAYLVFLLSSSWYLWVHRRRRVSAHEELEVR